MLSELENSLWQILKAHPDGIREFDLLRQLQDDRGVGFDPDLFRDNLAMYRSHFLLFHALYRLRDHLHGQQLADIDIHVLSIQLKAWETVAEGTLSAPDPMRAYYLDLERMENTGVEDVEKLMGQFWTMYFVDQKREQALTVLGLELNADRDEIEQRYRNMAMQLHPDRGGDKLEFQRLQQAIKTLRSGSQWR